MTDTLASIGEHRTLERLRRLLGTVDNIRTGIGDDAAVTRPVSTAKEFVLTSDAVIAGTHFNEQADGMSIGHKALGRVLSDLGAMGASPCWMLIDIAAPPETPIPFLEDIYRGMDQLARMFACAVVGGDLGGSRELQLHVFGIGTVNPGRAVLRSSARPGQGLYVTGTLGGSSAGHHLSFVPRVHEGIWLAQEQWAGAMIDLSDGLRRDLQHMCHNSHAGAKLDLECLPVSADAQRIAAAASTNPVHHALYDGEDFELLFSVPPEKECALQAQWTQMWPQVMLTRIGEITPPPVAVTDAAGHPLPLQDFRHFSPPLTELKAP